MSAWAVIAATAGLFAFGAVMYRAGRKSAQNEAFLARDRENEKVDTVINANASLGRDELLSRLRDNQNK